MECGLLPASYLRILCIAVIRIHSSFQSRFEYHSANGMAMVAGRFRIYDSPGSGASDGASRFRRRDLYERRLQFAWIVERGGCLADRTLVCQYGEQDGPTGHVISIGGSFAHDLRNCGNLSRLICSTERKIAIGQG